MKALYSVLRKEPYDVIHAKNPFSSLLIPVLLKKMGAIPSRILYDMQGLWVDFGVHSHQFTPAMGTILNKIDYTLMQSCDHVITISSELKRALTTRGIPSDHMTAITGGGVDVKGIAQIPPEDVRQVAGIKGTIIGYIGTVSIHRHSDKLIKAFQHVTEHCKDCYLILIGPEDGTVRKLILKTRNVIYLGYIPYKRAISLLKSFDLAVAYHDVEAPIFNVAVPQKVPEYMAAGVPIVATDHPMYQNVLTHKKTGFLTQQNPHKFGEGICTLLDDTELQHLLRDHALKEVGSYSTQSLVDELESVYQD
jgi:glycosyltransferase involved in cell wall biosynthesis